MDDDHERLAQRLARQLSRASIMPSAARRARIGAGAVIVVALLAVAVAVVVSMFSPQGRTTSLEALRGSDGSSSARPPTGQGVGSNSDDGSDEQAPGSGAELFVHVLGAVNRPGLYRLDDGARGFDAIAAAGGYADGADESAVNLARFVSDGEQLVVPVLGEAPVNGGVGAGGAGGASGAAGASGTAGGTVNLNTASAAELEVLPRIGPAMAARIIEWREANGRFTTVDDLGSVAGIGDKTLEGLRSLVRV
ncbi:ComEA family DNA-binding protein [Plantibacter sp. YIM 135347]|uniref:ComEA family DNA-binding protein n=1 Tax=Plantibacter sp. YIM 135347 TaxID=3423919 RepID=UPI003D35015F